MFSCFIALACIVNLSYQNPQVTSGNILATVNYFVSVRSDLETLHNCPSAVKTLESVIALSILTPCDRPIPSNVTTMQFVYDFQIFLCMGVYDSLLRLCERENILNSTALIPNLEARRNNQDGNFCKKFLEILKVVNTSYTQTAPWVNQTITKLQKPTVCSRVCFDLTKHVNPLCSFIYEANLLIASSDQGSANGKKIREHQSSLSGDAIMPVKPLGGSVNASVNSQQQVNGGNSASSSQVPDKSGIASNNVATENDAGTGKEESHAVESAEQSHIEVGQQLMNISNLKKAVEEPQAGGENNVAMPVPAKPSGENSDNKAASNILADSNGNIGHSGDTATKSQQLNGSTIGIEKDNQLQISDNSKDKIKASESTGSTNETHDQSLNGTGSATKDGNSKNEKPVAESGSDNTKPIVVPVSDTDTSVVVPGSDTTKNEVPPVSDTTKHEVPPVSDITKQDVLPVSDTTKHVVPPVSDTTKNDVPPVSDIESHESKPSGDTAKPEVAPVSDIENHESKPSGDTAKPEVAPVSGVLLPPPNDAKQVPEMTPFDPDSGDLPGDESFAKQPSYTDTDSDFELSNETVTLEKIPSSEKKTAAVDPGDGVTLSHQVTDSFVDAEDSHFFVYFVTMVVLCIIGYLAFHNKQKILALTLEGHSRRNSRRRRPNTTKYRKLDSNLEEAVTSSCKQSTTSVIY